LFLLLASLLVFAGAINGSNLIDQTLTDLQVLYVFEDPQAIDWPTLYYLSETSACRIDLLTISSGRGFYYQTSEIPDHAIFLHHYSVNPDDPELLDSVLAVQFRVRPPDIAIIAATEPSTAISKLAEKLQSLSQPVGSIYGLRKVYLEERNGSDTTISGRIVTIGRLEMYERYRDRMELEIPILYPWFRAEPLRDVHLMRYQLVWSQGLAGESDPDFLTGLEPLRLMPLLNVQLTDGAVKESFISRARLFIMSFDAARRTVGARRVDNAIAGYKALLALKDQVKSEPSLSGLPDFGPYLENLATRAQKAVLDEIGMDWNGEIALRDSPHGPKLKFRASLSVNGPQTVELAYVRFRPYWDSTEIMLDSISRKVPPHQSFVREYLVDIDRTRLEATMPESLVFAADIVYGTVPMTVTSSIPIWERPDLKIEFHPDFFFIPPTAQVEVDKIVSAMNWKAIITKPRYYHGTVTLSLETPRGVFAGAYKQSWQLDRDRVTETVRIPFSVSNLLEMGVQNQTITLAVDGREVAADTGILRIAACKIDDKVTIGLMPDTTGLLEDILRMAGANYRPLTDRTLQTGDLEAYTVILIGSGALRDYPSFDLITGRLEDYLRNGGSLVLLGQPSDWPQGALPVAFTPSIENVTAVELLNRMPQAEILSRPYSISEDSLLSRLQMRRRVSAAELSPAEKIYVTPTGAALLSVTRLGEGQIIFCGFPLVEMISELNIEAIHFLSNILNY
jgi:hypothetical protein